jgi:hypothetical protein
MAIDSNIALGVKPIQIDSPLNSLAQLYQLKNAQSQGQMNDLNMQERTRGIEDSNKLRNLYAQPGFDMNSPESMRQVMGISPSQGMAMQKSQLDNRKTQGDIDKTSFDTASKSHSIYQNTLGALAYSPNLTKDAVVQAGQGLVQAGVLKPEVLQQQLSGLSDDPIALKAQLLQGVHAQLTPDQLLTAFAPKPTQMDNGQSVSFRDTNPNSPTYGQMTGGAAMPKMQSPDSAANTAISRERLAFDKSKEDGSQDSVMDPLAVRMAAQQYLAGDDGALKNFGRGAQGAKNLNAVRLEITKQATDAGLNGADIAAKIAEFGGIKAGQRTTGTRTANIEIAANEAAQLAPLALDASLKVSRSGLLPFGKLQIMFDSNTNDLNLRQFSMANNALVNAYGQVMSRGGVATVSDKEHARELLATSFDQPSYAAAVQQLQAEIKAAQAAPGMARKDISRAVSGRTEETSPISKPAAIPSGWSVKER